MENNFDFVDLSKNDSFSSLNGSDIQELVYQLNHYLLEMRDELGFDNSITFGTEIEFENIRNGKTFLDVQNNFNKINGEIFNKNSWEIGHDVSLTKGGEIQSPILTDKKENWEDLKKICEFVKKYASVGEHTAAHVHVGAHIFKGRKENWLNLLKLWSTYENVIYRFVYGEYLTKLPGIGFCSPSASVFANDYKSLKTKRVSFDQLISEISHRRGQAINFKNVNTLSCDLADRNTIEFRCPNGTIEPAIWQNNVNLFISLLLYSKKRDYDFDTIEERLKSLPYNISDSSNIYSYYTQIYLEQALELVDLIFRRNIDKVYFLKQYLKSFMISNDPMKVSPTLTKNATKK